MVTELEMVLLNPKGIFSIITHIQNICITQCNALQFPHLHFCSNVWGFNELMLLFNKDALN